MPYIKHERRAALDVIIEGLINRLKELQDLKRGDLNYVVTRLVLETLNHDSYHSLSDCVSVLRDAADEIVRRLLGPYEDTAIEKNGDMLCFQKSYANTQKEQTGCCKPLVHISDTSKVETNPCKEIEIDDSLHNYVVGMGTHPRTVEPAEAATDAYPPEKLPKLNEVADNLADELVKQREWQRAIIAPENTRRVQLGLPEMSKDEARIYINARL